MIQPATLAAALVPTAALIAIGWVLRNRLGFGEDFWPDLEKLTYFLLLPALFVHSLATADFGTLQVGTMSLVLAVSSVLGACAVWLLRRFITADGPAYTSVFQGSVRFNNYIGLVVTSALLGKEGLALAALSVAVLVPIVNATSTLTLALHAGGKPSVGSVLREIATNPLILSCVIGMAGYALRTGVAAPLLTGAVGATFGVLGEILRILGSASLPIGLLCVGAGLRRPDAAGSTTRLIAWACVLCFVVVPLITLGVIKAFGLTGSTALVAILFQSLPTASSSYVLARRLGGDSVLMAAIIAVQTVVSLVTIPVWLTVGQFL